MAALASVKSLDTLQHRMCEASRTMLDADGVVIVSDTVDAGRVTVCWTTLQSRRLARLQHVCDEGPLVDAARTGEMVVGDFHDTTDDRWPELRRELDALEFAGSVVAIPLRSELSLRGALLAHHAGDVRPPSAAEARVLGAAVGTALLQDPDIGAQSHVFAEVLTGRDLGHRATDALAVETSIRYEDALAVLRAVAFMQGRTLADVARTALGRRGLLAAGDLPTID